MQEALEIYRDKDLVEEQSNYFYRIVIPFPTI